MSALPVLAPNTDETTETVFDFDELFFWRSDSQGLIQGGNSVLQRVTGTPLKDLRGKPFGALQHQDTPQGLLWLIRNSIQSGDALGAYIKTLAQADKHFWAFAVITPHLGGSVSVRFKPSTPLLDRISDLYDDLRKAEQEEPLDAAQSAKRLVAMLRQEGFANYHDFMAYAFAQEFIARAGKLDRPKTLNITQYLGLRDRLRDIRQNGLEIVDAVKGIQTSPKNMRIQSARMGQRAAPLSVISANFDLLADGIRSRVDSFLASSDAVLSKISGGLFVSCAGNILSEMILLFRLENTGSDTHADGEEETSQLKTISAQYVSMNETALQEILMEITSFTEMCIQLRRTLSGLSVTRVMSQIESARIGDDTGGMSEIIAQLQRFQTLTYERLNTIEQESESMQAEVRQMMSDNEQLSYA